MGIQEDMFNKIDNELQSEQGFFSVFKNSLRHSFKFRMWRVLLLVLFFILFFVLQVPIMIADGSYLIVGKFFDAGFNSSITILGFLIAGFAIYSTFVDKDLMYFLLNYREKTAKINKFQSNYLHFMKPFFYFFILFLLSFFGNTILNSWTGIKGFVGEFLSTNDCVLQFNILLSLIMAAYLVFFLICILSLADFIYNVYATAKMIGRFEFYKRHYNFDLDELIKRVNGKKDK